MINQPMHAGYEATLYRFNPNGTIKIVGWFPEEYETGTVWDPEDSVICTFGNTWQSPNSTTLIVQSLCSDSMARDIEIEFSHFNSEYHPRIIEVGGDTGWRHWGFDWVWDKCEDEEKCFNNVINWGGSVNVVKRRLEYKPVIRYNGSGNGLNIIVNRIASSKLHFVYTVDGRFVGKLVVGD